MYARDVPAIREYAEASPANLADVATFVLLSIRVPFGRVAASMRNVRHVGRESAFLWGWKQEGFDYIEAHKTELFFDCCVARHSVVETIDRLAAIPGLGIVKGAFVAQMLGHDVACFDSRNLDSLEWGGRPFRFDKKSFKTVAARRRKIAEYVQMTVETGGAAHWWDHWCNGIAPSLATSGDRVSRLHWLIVTGRAK